jgi:hypothetical protein
MTTTVARVIDETMEKASKALVETEYFAAEQHALKALRKALAARDWERLSRIALPLQEARRQRRHEATDSGAVFVMKTVPSSKEALAVGCYLLRPPLIAAEAKMVRLIADRQKVPTMILTREPTTKLGKWPVVAVGPDVSIRIQVDPPGGGGDGAEAVPSVRWMLAAQEALGDAAIAKLRAQDPAAHRVEDLIDFLEAIPDHEKLHQKLADECRRAMAEPAPTKPRRRPIVVEDWSF